MELVIVCKSSISKGPLSGQGKLEFKKNVFILQGVFA